MKKIIEKNQLIIKFKENRKILNKSLISTLIFGLLAHSYMFFGNAFSHDTMADIILDKNSILWKIQLGRFIVPLYRSIVCGRFTLPWLIGFLALLYIGFSVFLVVKIFDIKQNVIIVLFAGLFSTNIAVTAQAATYINELDCNMFALLLSVIAVFLWQRYEKGFLPGIIMVCISLGIYQSYIQVTIGLAIIYLVVQLINGHDCKKVISLGFKSIIMLIGAGILYFLILKITTGIFSVSTDAGTYNSLSGGLASYSHLKEFFFSFYLAYKNIIRIFMHGRSLFPLIVFCANVVVSFLGCVVAVISVFSRKIEAKSKLVLVLLYLLLPFGLNITYILTGGPNGVQHDLMRYSFNLLYVFFVLVTVIMQAVHNKKYLDFFAKIITVLITLVLILNIQISNSVYLKKSLESDATKSLMTRVVSDMERCDGYFSGITPVVFIGNSNDLVYSEGFETVMNITGCGMSSSLGSSGPAYYQSYFDNIMMINVKVADEDKWIEMKDRSIVIEMPCFPKEGYCTIVDNILVVKLSDEEIG